MLIKIMKRLSAVCLLLAVFLCVAAPATAADYVTGDQVPIYMDFCILFKLKERDAAGFPWMATKYCYTIENGASLATDGDWLYCIDYYGHAQQGMVSATATALDETAEWNSLSITAQRGITYALIYGGANYSDEIYGYAATQLIIWEYQLNQRITPTDSVSFFASTLSQSERLKTAYEEINFAMSSHMEVPVFSSKEVILRGIGEEHAVTITDQSNLLSKDNWSVVSGGENLVVQQEGINLTIYATEDFLQGTTSELLLQKNLAVGCGNAVCVLTGSQRAIIGTPPDPVFASISVRLEETAKLKLIKQSKDGAVAGISFSVEEKTTEEYLSLGTYVTGEDGTLSISNLIVGRTYRLTEAVPEGYEAEQEVQEITIINGENTVTFVNHRITEDLTIIKKLAEGSSGPVSGIQFHIYGQGGQLEREVIGFTIEESAEKSPNEEKSIVIGGLPLKAVPLPDNYSAPVRVTYNGGALPKTTSFRILDQRVLIYDSTSALAAGYYEISYNISVPTKGALIATVETQQDGSFGKAIVEQLLPGETYWIEEVVPEGFMPQPDQTITIIQGGENVVTFVNERILGEIQVKKEDASGKPLADVCFLLEYSSDGMIWSPVRFDHQGGALGICTSEALENGCLTTEESGIAVFSGLRLDCFYRLTEVKTVNGQSLLSDPIYEGTLVDKTTSVLKITVVNSGVYVLPATGCTGVWPVILGLPITGVSLYLGPLLFRRRKFRNEV